MKRALNKAMNNVFNIKELGILNIHIDSKKTTDGYFTNSEITLIVYHSLKYFGILPRVDVSIADVTRLLHLITRKEYTKIQNSIFYKKMRYVPNFKRDNELLHDLETIQPLFKQVGFYTIAAWIQEEINLAKSC